MVGITGSIVFLSVELAMVAKFVGTTNHAGLSVGGDQSVFHPVFRLTLSEVFALFGYVVFFSGQVLSFNLLSLSESNCFVSTHCF